MSTAEDTDEDRASRQITVPSENVAVVAMRDDGDLYENVEGGVFATTGDFGSIDVDDDAGIEAFRERVAELVGRFFERDDGTVYELVGGFNGFAVYREADAVKADAEPAHYARVFMVEWSRFEAEFDLTGDPRSTEEALEGGDE